MIGSTCGNSPNRTASRLVPPLASTDSRARSSVDSIASENNLPSAPVSETAIARIPANGTEADDADKDQRPDQRVDAADGVEAAADREANDGMGRGIAGGEKADRECDDGRNQGSQERDGQRLAHRLEQQVEVTAGRRRKHQRDEFRERRQPGPIWLKGISSHQTAKTVKPAKPSGAASAEAR